MTQQQIERIIKSTVHIVMTNPFTREPESGGSGCIIDYNKTEVLLTVAHVTNMDAATCIDIGEPTVNNQNKVYSVGAMNYLESFDLNRYNAQISQLQTNSGRIEEKNFGLIDFSFAKLEHKTNYLQCKIEFNDFTIQSGSKLRIKSDLTDVPDPTAQYGFFGRIKSELGYINNILTLSVNEVFYGGLKYIRKIGHYYEFQLPNQINSHTDFRGTSGAPIMDTNGNLLSLVTHGYEGADKLYGIALADFKVGVDATLLTN
ncbi:hypothetical protein [Spirosoma endbachense]|uniref:Serine protease n=1 Tax=Spirosoma endbachense TaxID=2666025 RepID=A0A6P1W6F7_9BACT|nr:hypothetical protein [Spirosoma endbachense]QHV99306.1 hypothetical protein GJR95_31735 [Spirosoma endbachense]